MAELERETQMMKLRVAEVEQVTEAGGGWPWVLPRAFTSGVAQAEPEPEPEGFFPTERGGCRGCKASSNDN